MVSNDSIINVIQKMVQEGQSRETILETLRDLGVNDEQSKKLLLIAEADTFTLLKKEINSLVREEFESNKKDFEDLIHKELINIEDKEKSRIKEIATESLKGVETDIRSESRGFQDSVNQTISTSQKTVSMVKIALDSINEKISQMDLDIEQLKVHKFRKKSMFFSYVMLALGAVLLIAGLSMFVINLKDLDIGQMMLLVVIMLASITLCFASIIA